MISHWCLWLKCQFQCSGSVLNTLFFIYLNSIGHFFLKFCYCCSFIVYNIFWSVQFVLVVLILGVQIRYWANPLTFTLISFYMSVLFHVYRPTEISNNEQLNCWHDIHMSKTSMDGSIKKKCCVDFPLHEYLLSLNKSLKGLKMFFGFCEWFKIIEFCKAFSVQCLCSTDLVKLFQWEAATHQSMNSQLKHAPVQLLIIRLPVSCTTVRI